MNQPILQSQALPYWLQIVLAAVAVLGFVGGACAFLFVMWPAIRKSESRAQRMERWADSPEGRRVFRLIVAKVTGLTGDRVEPDAFLRESSKADTTAEL